MPYGVTFLALRGRDAFLAALGGTMHARSGLPLGALSVSQPAWTPSATAKAADEIAIAVVGAHLSGMPLNHELAILSGRFIEATETAADYRLYALKGEGPQRPGLLRTETGQGSRITVEIWALPVSGFGRFVAAVPSPLSIGTLRLADGRAVKGFLVEAEGVDGARDISSFGGWRAYINSRTA
jgi:allophanate hydrolase